MKSKLNLLSLTLASLLLPHVIFAGDAMPTVTVNGSPILTYSMKAGNIEPVADPACIKDLAEAGCKGNNCKITSGTILKFPSEGCNSISFSLKGGSGCSNSQAEFYLSSTGSTYDVSLVNGYGTPVSITGGNPPINVTASNHRDLIKGVYPYGCSQCFQRTSNDCGFDTYGATKGCQPENNQQCQITYDSSKAYTVTFG